MKEMKFNLSNKEWEDIEKFKEKHRESCTCKQNLTLGEYWTYLFIPGGLGSIIKIKCNICGTEEDVTDVNSW